MNYSNSILKNLKIKSTIVLTTLGLILGGGGLSLALPGTAYASPTVIYNNIPNPTPGNLPSDGFEATSTSEFGGQVQFAGTTRYNPVVTVLMSSWGCQAGGWSTDNCVTTPGATFSEPITLNIYNVNADNSPGSLVSTLTETFNIPFRPSADATNCTVGEWYDATDATCYNGLNTPISFDFTGLNVTLPNNVIIGVAYNTSDYGSTPYGDATTCHSTLEGCGYDSLNVSTNPLPSVGTALPTINDAYQSSTWAGAYCDLGEAGTGTFRLDAVCWTGYLPAFEVSASSTITLSAPHITSPHNGATLTSAQFTKVNWSNVSGTSPVTYQYQAFYDSGYTNPAYSSGWLTASEIPTPGTPVGNYFIQVRAKDGNGDLSQWSNDATNPYLITVVAEVPPPTTKADCYNNGWEIYNTPSFNNRNRCIDYVINHEHKISGDVKYTAYGLKREANFNMNTADNDGYFSYSDANHGWYKVKVSDVAVKGNDGYFTGVITKASNKSWVGQWLFAKVQNGKPDMIWGSFTTQSGGQNGVTNMSSPADGPFNVTNGNLKVN